MATYELMLRGVQSLFAATGTIDRDNFRAMSSALNLDANFSGVQAMGLIEWVPAARKRPMLRGCARAVFPTTRFIPQGFARTTRRSFSANLIGLTRSSPGFDAWADPVRRAAMEKARDSGMAAISGKSAWAWTWADARPAFVMYLPIYARASRTTTSRSAGRILSAGSMRRFACTM